MSWLIYSFLAILPLLYWYLTRNFNYWSKRGIKGPRPMPFFGTIWVSMFQPPALYELKWFKKYGKLYGAYQGNKPVICVGDPEIIKTILVKDFQLFPDRRKIANPHPIQRYNLIDATGDTWRRIRAIVSPTFTSGKMKRMYPMIGDCLKDFIDHLQAFARDRKDVNVKDIYGNYTMDVIATCAFGTKINSHKQLDNPFVVNARKSFDFNMLQVVMSMIVPSFVLKILFKTQTFSSEFFFTYIRDIIENRKKSNKKYNDFLQLVLDVQKGSNLDERDENDVSEAHHVNEGEEELEVNRKTLNLSSKDRSLSENEIIAQANIFLLAGYETTATALMYVTYELALNPSVQERLCEELNGAVDPSGHISYEDLAKLPFLDAVLSETLRLHSPAASLSRVASTDYKLGDTGLTIEKGTVVKFPVLALHLSEEYYPDPYKFDPDRFMPENRHKLTPYTYLPFGAGPRNCIGMRFALLEAKIALAHIVRKFKFFRSSQTDVPLVLKKSILNTPQRILVGIEAR